MFNSLKTTGLALAAGSLALSAPASAAPVAHAAAWDNAPVYGDTVFEHGKGHHKRKHRAKHGDSYGSYGYDRGYAGQPYYMQYSQNDGQPIYNNTRVWQGDDGRYYCQRTNGTTGLLIGAGVGALLGSQVLVRDRTLGAIVGAAGGALLGRQIDRNRTRCR